MPKRFFEFQPHSILVSDYFIFGSLFTTSDSCLVDAEYVEMACLGMGMALRDIHAVQFQFQEPDGTSDLPEFMAKCSFTLDNQIPILEACEILLKMIDDEVSVPSDLWVFFGFYLIFPFSHFHFFDSLGTSKVTAAASAIPEIPTEQTPEKSSPEAERTKPTSSGGLKRKISDELIDGQRYVLHL